MTTSRLGDSHSCTSEITWHLYNNIDSQAPVGGDSDLTGLGWGLDIRIHLKITTWFEAAARVTLPPLCHTIYATYSNKVNGKARLGTRPADPQPRGPGKRREKLKIGHYFF